MAYLDIAEVLIVALDIKGRVSLINRKGCEVLGLDEGEVVGKDWFTNFVTEEAREETRRLFKQFISGETDLFGYHVNPVVAAGDGERVVAWHNAALRDGEGNVTTVLAFGDAIKGDGEALNGFVHYDGNLEKMVGERTRELKEARLRLSEEIAERKRMEKEIRKLSAAIEHSRSVVFVTDYNGNIEYVNDMFTRVTGYSREELLGKNPEEFVCEESLAEVSDGMHTVLKLEGCWKCVLKCKTKGGGYYWANAAFTPVTDEDGKITNILGIAEDITEKKNSNERIEYLANFDAVTGLTNRSRFIDVLDGWISGAEGRGGSRGALFLLDIDQFKFLCDTYGHGMGDEFLRRLASLLKITVRYVDSQYLSDKGQHSVLCRLSGDEFAVFVPSVDKVEAVIIAEQVRKGVEGFYQADVPNHVTASIGVALYPDHGRTTTELLTRSDAAMYRAKELGRNRFHFFSPADRDIERMHTRLEWKEEILSALREDRFETWFQPIQNLKDGTTKHYEVLARMRDREGKLKLPGPFIDIAERFGLVGSIGKVITEKTMRTQVELSKRGNPLTFCINVSGKELGDREFLYFVQSKIFETGVDPASLTFEITETASIMDLDRAVRSIRALKSLGCGISLDDFGIGFTSFLYLKEMEVDCIKIAGSFIKHICENLNDQLFVKAIVDVARGMGVKTIAEFVEDEKALQIVRDLGVDYAQGYLLGKPSPSIQETTYRAEVVND